MGAIKLKRYLWLAVSSLAPGGPTQEFDLG